MHYHLGPLSFEETRKYIQHRLNHAKANGRDMNALFVEEAIHEIHKLSRGLPRLINAYCDHALLTGCVSESKEITSEIVEELAGEFRL